MRSERLGTVRYWAIRFLFAIVVACGVSLKLYLVTCELAGDGDYRSLRERLRSLEARQILAGQWALRSTHSAAGLKNILRGFLGEGDRIMVAEVGAEWASRRAMANLGEL